MKQSLELKNRIKTEYFYLRHELERFNSQKKFAEKLLELYPAKQKKFATLIENAIAIVESLPELIIK